MGIRTNVDLTVQAGLDNSLDNLAFSQSFQELLDTMEHAQVEVGQLPALTTNQAVGFGDVEIGRLFYIEADGDIQVSFGGVAATAAQIDGTGGTFNTGFIGGEILDWNVDGTALQTTFTSADQTAAQVAARMNSTAALAGLPTPIVTEIAGPNLRITSPTTGSTSTLAITASTTATTLGLSGTATGTDPVSGSPPMSLKRMGDPAGSSIDDLKAYILTTTQATSLFISNLDPSTAVNYKVLIVGDLSPTAVC